MNLRAILPAILPALLAMAAPAAAATAEPRADVRVTECRSALVQAERAMVVQGRMRALRGAARMQIRFDLQVRVPGRPRWKTLAAPGFGTWYSSEGAPARFVFSKRVENLTAPATFRMVVRYRWLDAGGRRIATARRVSRSCRQADLRPDLELRRVTVGTGPTPEERLYVVPVRNTGRSAAGPFSVSLTIGGVAQPAEAVTGLEPGEVRELEIVAPACRPETVIIVRVDADATVDEADEADDELVRACPGGGRQAARMQRP
ncbi:MAG: hypothetical protein M3P50_02805 [Actinomycetota bacterium]|nr:hypothetical protein [Actinomycetota bacterium]